MSSNQPAVGAGPIDLTPEQIATLTAPINRNRIQHVQGQSHVEAWDVRRWLTRVFGFGGWSDETLELACVSEREINPGRWTVTYRAQVRLTVKTKDGRTISSWDDAAVGHSPNQKSVGDAHDMAMKTALSQALKRCAVNLGDAFGLSLYNDGSALAVVSWTAVQARPKSVESAVAKDEPVRPEQGAERDFVAEAERCATADCAVEVYQKAKAAEAGTGVLRKITAIGKRLREAEQQPSDKTVVDGGVIDVAEETAHAAAVNALREFAAEQGITDIDGQAHAALGAPLDDVSAVVIQGLLSSLIAQTNQS